MVVYFMHHSPVQLNFKCSDNAQIVSTERDPVLCLLIHALDCNNLDGLEQCFLLQGLHCNHRDDLVAVKYIQWLGSTAFRGSGFQFHNSLSEDTSPDLRPNGLPRILRLCSRLHPAGGNNIRTPSQSSLIRNFYNSFFKSPVNTGPADLICLPKTILSSQDSNWWTFTALHLWQVSAKNLFLPPHAAWPA